jgi:hypothetical protein
VENAAYPTEVGAHTSPVYVAAGSEALFDAPDAAYLLALLDVGQAWLDTLAIPASPERHARARRVLDEARDRLHRRLHDRHARPGAWRTPGAGEPRA